MAARVLYERGPSVRRANVVLSPMVLYGPSVAARASSPRRRRSSAASLYADAIEHTRKMGAPLFLAPAEADQAVFLVRGVPGDRARAAEAAEHATEAARRLGMESLAARAEALGREARTTTSTPPDVRPIGGAPEELVFRRDGDYWTIGNEGRATRLRDAMGFRYLARLLGHPDVEFHVLDLVASTDGGRTHTDAPIVAGAAGEFVDRGLTHSRGEAGLPILDTRAEDATGAGSRTCGRSWPRRGRSTTRAGPRRPSTRSSSAAELARARGLGGRERRTASGAEQARINVTKRIKLAIRRIEEHDPSLARCLRRRCAPAPSAATARSPAADHLAPRLIGCVAAHEGTPIVSCST
jgi:hypothetical protein